MPCKYGNASCVTWCSLAGLLLYTVVNRCSVGLMLHFCGRLDLLEAKASGTKCIYFALLIVCVQNRHLCVEVLEAKPGKAIMLIQMTHQSQTQPQKHDTLIRQCIHSNGSSWDQVLAYDLSTPCCAGFVLSGYFQGKRNAEHAMAEAYPDQGVCLRPGFIHGTRYVSGVGIPLSFIGKVMLP